MFSAHYTVEKNTQIMIALLKAHDIHDVIISPGATNDCFVLSIQGNPDFNLYSAVDERHAGYLACGMAQETGKPVVINCTGATASRNYMSPLTEAYYRKLPIIALTCSQHSSRIGNLFPQVTDRIHLPSDIVKLSVQCPVPHTDEEFSDCELKINRALLELNHRGGGPVHINLETDYSGDYSVTALPKVRKIHRWMQADENRWPSISSECKVVVWIGSHRKFNDEETRALERFVDSHQCVVLCDQTSNYFGRGYVQPSILCWQLGMRANPKYESLVPDLVIHIGEVSGDYPTFGYLNRLAKVWRVNEDGELRDFLGRLENVFEAPEVAFFEHFSKPDVVENNFLKHWQKAVEALHSSLPQLPFSELMIVNELAHNLLTDAHLHLGILNPLRCCNLVDVAAQTAFCPVGGFGIDGGTSQMIGSAIARPDVLHIGVFGDLSFFYDLNALGNRHVKSNLRLVLINNGEGGEFVVPGNISDNANCGERVHDFIAARGHFGKQSKTLVKDYVTALGFEYFAVSSSEELASAIPKIVDKSSTVPILVECFTNSEDDRRALSLVRAIDPFDSQNGGGIVSMAKEMMPQRLKNVIKAAIGR